MIFLWLTFCDRLKKYTESEAQKAAKPAASPWVTIGNVEAEVPLSAAGKSIIQYSPDGQSKANCSQDLDGA